jgi:hypothetical protein
MMRSAKQPPTGELAYQSVFEMEEGNMGVKLDRRSGIVPALIALAAIVPAVVASPAAAQEHKPYTMGYAVGFLSTPFLAIGVDQT